MRRAGYTLHTGRIGGGECDIQITYLPSRRAFLRYCRSITLKNGRRTSGRGAAAKFYSFVDEPGERPTVGEIVFYRDHFTDDSIAHECTHALLHVFRRAKVCPLTGGLDAEETFATLLGNLTGAVADWRARHGLAPHGP